MPEGQGYRFLDLFAVVLLSMVMMISLPGISRAADPIDNDDGIMGPHLSELEGNIEDSLFRPGMREAWALVELALARKDWSHAISVLAPLAENGLPKAAVEMGNLLHTGKGLKRDRKKAIQWYKKAADGGHIHAMRRMADIMRKGDGVPVNYKAAIQWSYQAAARGDMESVWQLARHFESGMGTAQDLVRAMSLYQQAADQGHDKASKRLRQIEDRQTRLAQNKKAFTFQDVVARPTDDENDLGTEITPYGGQSPGPSVTNQNRKWTPGPAPDLFTSPDLRPEQRKIDAAPETRKSTGPAFSLFLEEDDKKTKPNSE